jgi:hypothetical protein
MVNPKVAGSIRERVREAFRQAPATSICQGLTR